VTKKPFAIIINYLLILIFENMKKLFGIIAIALLFSFVSMQEVYADEWDIVVNWSDDCLDCPTVGDYQYVVCLRIRNTCENEEVYYSCVEVASSAQLTHTFHVDDVCEADGQQCFLVTANVKKICVIGGSTICWNYKGVNKSCDEIDDGFTMDVELE